VTEWKSDEPLLVAGFNYGDFKKKERVDDVGQVQPGTYATTEPPDWLKAASGGRRSTTWAARTRAAADLAASC